MFTDPKPQVVASKNIVQLVRHVAGMHPESRADSPAASPNVRQFLQGLVPNSDP